MAAFVSLGSRGRANLEYSLVFFCAVDDFLHAAEEGDVDDLREMLRHYDRKFSVSLACASTMTALLD